MVCEPTPAESPTNNPETSVIPSPDQFPPAGKPDRFIESEIQIVESVPAVTVGKLLMTNCMVSLF